MSDGKRVPQYNQSTVQDPPPPPEPIEEMLNSGQTRQVILWFNNYEIDLDDEAGVVAHGAEKVSQLPVGYVQFVGAVADLYLERSNEGVNEDWEGDFSVGTVAADNDATLSGTEADLIPSTGTPAAVSGMASAQGQSTTSEQAILDGNSGDPVDVYLNVLVDDTDHNVAAQEDGTKLIVNGFIALTYIVLGEYQPYTPPAQ